MKEIEQDAKFYESIDPVYAEIRNFVEMVKRVNEFINQRSKNFDGTHCIFCGEEILPRERVTKLGKTYCKKCSEVFLRFR